MNPYDDKNIEQKTNKKFKPTKVSKKKVKAEKKEVDMNDLKKELDIVSINIFTIIKKTYLSEMLNEFNKKEFKCNFNLGWS